MGLAQGPNYSVLPEGNARECKKKMYVNFFGLRHQGITGYTLQAEPTIGGPNSNATPDPPKPPTHVRWRLNVLGMSDNTCRRFSWPSQSLQHRSHAHKKPILPCPHETDSKTQRPDQETLPIEYYVPPMRNARHEARTPSC